MNAPVALLGTGIMGSGIAQRLLERGFSVDVWNRTPGPAAELAARGATAHATAPGAVAESDVVITMLPNEAALDAVMLSGGVLQALRPHATWAQMGTIGIEGTTRLHAEVVRRRPDVNFVDAPVSGSRQPARTGRLVVYASGPDDAKAALKPVFDALAERTLWLGKAGSGSRMKLVINSLLAFEIEAVAEMRAIAARLDLAPNELTEALQGSSLASAVEMTKLAKMESGDDSPDFPLEWALKDLDLVLHAAGAGAAPVTASIAERWRGLVDHGYGRLDVSAARMGLEASSKQGVTA
jgi:3-hydroxyisobutyrate dehydrogenase